MRKIYSIFFLVLTWGIQSAQAQTRYLDEVFTDVSVDTSIMYGVNATVLYYSVIGQAVPQPLMMDVYTPSGDVETSRPLMIYLHSGNFLPDNYTTGGTRRDSSVVELCSRYAKMGYVVASCDYRLGWNPLDTTQDGRVTTLINAAYRGVQDCRTAVRYFRKSFQDAGNPYGIDTSRIVVTGQGTGGYIALANATLDTYTDVVLPKFTHIVQTPNGPIPMPMVLEAINGDLDGTTFGTTAGFVMPGTEDTLCYPNHVGYASNVHATVNMGGALGDSSWFDAGDGPFISFQVPSDPYAPYGDGMVIVPYFNLNVVEVSGSLTVQQMAYQYGNNDVFYPMENSSINAAYTAAANVNNNGLYGLYPFVRPATQPADSAPWDWWALTDESSTAALAANPDMSAAKGKAFCDTIVKYSAPRLMCALNLPNSPCLQSVSELASKGFNVYPNPSNGQFMVSAQDGIESVVMYNSFGQIIQQVMGLNTRQWINSEDLAAGVYLIEVQSKGRKSTQRLIVQ